MAALPVELWRGEASEGDLARVAAEVTARLGEDFRLWLVGDLGAGKTTLTGYLLRHLGLDERIPVTSPTYTYMNEYRIGGEWYAHLDLYRARGAVHPEEMGLADARRFRGVFVEWPDRATPDDPYLSPTHVLAIDLLDGGARRAYRLTQTT